MQHSLDPKPDIPRAPAARRPPIRRFPVRRWLRACHRDAGYLAVGLTVVYALSGLAVNHVADWDPNFTAIEKTLPFPAALRGQTVDPADAASQLAMAQRLAGLLGRDEPVQDALALDATHLDVSFEDSTLYVDLQAHTIREEGQRARPLLRLANWLHLNRGKKAWTYIADGYAVFLLFLAFSGLFMLPGKKGLRGRGAVLALTGAAIPVLYVVLSGGP